VIIPPDRKLLIRELNDRFRTRLEGGRLFFAGDLARAPRAMLQEALQKAKNYDAFTPANDPTGQHDFGDFMLDGRHVFWKIDYLDSAAERASPDATDPDLTTRVLTITYAEDFEGDE